jgi:hypothetical protein
MLWEYRKQNLLFVLRHAVRRTVPLLMTTPIFGDKFWGRKVLLDPMSEVRLRGAGENNH